jgi:WD40 repeat protein
LEIRDVESRELLASAAQTEHLRLVRWSQDGSLIATTAENRIRLWDPSLRPVRELAGHTARVIGLHWDRQSNQLWSAASDGSVKTWDAATGQELHAASVPMISAAAADWNPHGTEVAFCDGNQIVLANTKTGESLAVWQTARVPYDGFGELISWSDDGRKLSIAQTSWSAPVPVWSVARMKERHTAQTPMRLSAPPPINGVPLDWSRDGQFLASSRNGLTIWHTMPLRPVQAIDVGDYPPQQFQFSPDARRLAIAEGYEVPNHYGPDPAVTAKAGTGVRVVRVDDGSMVWQKPLSDGVCSVAWSTDGAYLAASTWREPLVHLFDGTTGAELPKISATSMMMSQIDWAPSGHRLATAANYRVEVRDIEVDTVTFSAPAELHNAYRIRFNRDGTRLAYNMSEGLIRVVHVAPNSSPSSLEGHTHNLIGLDWSSDDSRLASVDRSGTVRVWDVTRNQEILSLGEFGFAVAWDPTGPRLAVSNAEGDVAILDASPSYERESPPELVTKLEHRLARTPSDHELAERLDVALARAGQWDRATAVCEDRATKSVASPITQLGWWSLSGQAADSWRQRHHRSDSSPGHEPASSPPISERFATVNASAAVSRSARVDSPPVRESTLTPDRADWPADARWYTPVDGANGWAPIVPEVSVYVSRIHATRDLDAALVLGIHSVESLWLNGREIQPAGADASTKRNRLHTLVRLGAGWNTLTVFVPSDREPDRYASVQARFSSEPADLALAYSRAGRGDQAAAAARASDPSDPRLTRVINP